MQGMSGMMERHMAALPAEYAELKDPIPAEADSLARGKAIYESNCAACHGESGWGDGPAASALDPAPAPLAHTAPMLSDGYLFYRISKGGNFAPFNSAMPAWKETLTDSERWDVVNYVRSLGGDTMMGDGMMSMMGWMMAPWWILGWTLVISLIAVAVAGVVWLVRHPRSEPPLAILKRRYASGEITADQFEAIKHQLSNEA
jgi:mono/diheme cytochrome c family protein